MQLHRACPPPLLLVFYLHQFQVTVVAQLLAGSVHPTRCTVRAAQPLALYPLHDEHAPGGDVGAHGGDVDALWSACGVGGGRGAFMYVGFNMPGLQLYPDG